MKQQTFELPKIYLSASDEENLRNLVLQTPKGEGRELLEEELNRAEILPARPFPADIVKMNSTVRFMDEDSGEEMKLTLVLPGKADIQARRISVLAPVGAALLGLPSGQSISWPMPDGRIRTLKILEVLQRSPAEVLPERPAEQRGSSETDASFAWEAACEGRGVRRPSLKRPSAASRPPRKRNPVHGSILQNRTQGPGP